LSSVSLTLTSCQNLASRTVPKNMPVSIQSGLHRGDLTLPAKGLVSKGAHTSLAAHASVSWRQHRQSSHRMLLVAFSRKASQPRRDIQERALDLISAEG